ncbi:hypothetical protein EAE96_000531 [Botrytis aclada]|nr:hypothetical protein EAE96_000531 [Botrytis aclada]
MHHNHNHDSEALTVARYHNHKTNSYLNPNAAPIWTGIFDPSFRVLILPRYLGVQTAIIPLPTSRRITSSEYEQEQQKLREQRLREQKQEDCPQESESKDPLSSPSPTPSTHSSCSCSCSCFSESSHSTLRTSSSSSDSSHTSISSPTNSIHIHIDTHPNNPNLNISEEPALPITQLSPKRLACPDSFSKTQDEPTRISTPKPSLGMLSDSDSDSDCEEDDYEGVVDEDYDFQPVIKDHEEEDSAICDLMEGFRKMSI